jgi:predicted ATP-grasp superfamily ATP-dependent carboligase
VSGSVVVTDAEERAALGACRGLTAAGYRVCAVARLRPAATHWSRACAERVTLPDPRANVTGFAEGLEELLQRGHYDALIPGSDASLMAVSEHRERLDPWTRLGLPSREAVRQSVDKVALLQAAADAGLAAPASRCCTSLEEAQEAAVELGFPVVVKPGQSFTAVNGGLRQQSVVVVADAAALAAAVPAFATPFVVQHFERAQFVSCTGVVADGRLLALTTSRVTRLWPPAAGMHSFAETVAAPRGLAERLRTVLGSLGWQGIFQLQMLELPDGRLAVIDLNPRVFASIALDVDAGANLAAVWCDWLLGRDPAPVTARPARRYRWEEGDLCNFAWQLRHRRLRAAAGVLLPHRRVTHAWFRATDPGPLLARGLNLAFRKSPSGSTA